MMQGKNKLYFIYFVKLKKYTTINFFKKLKKNFHVMRRPKHFENCCFFVFNQSKLTFCAFELNTRTCLIKFLDQIAWSIKRLEVVRSASFYNNLQQVNKLTTQ